MRILERLGQPRILLVAMVSLQVFWLVMRWVLMPAPDWEQFSIMLAYTIPAGVAIGLMPAGLVFRFRQLRESLIQNEKLLVLSLCMAVLIPGVICANYGQVSPDEMRNLEAARMIAAEGVVPFFANYGKLAWLGNQHPPLVPLVDGLTMRVLGVNLLVMRLVSLVLSMATVLITYSLGRDLYDRETGLLGALLFLSFPYVLYIGTWANNDIPTMFFFSLALFLTLRLLRTPTYWLSVAAGISIGAGLLSKYTMVLVYAVLLGCLVVIGPFRRLKFHLGIIILVSVGILAVWLACANYIGVLEMQSSRLAAYTGVDADESGMLRLVARWMEMKFLFDWYPRLLVAFGIYNIPILLVGGWHLVRRRSRSDLFVVVWIAAVFGPLFLTMPDPRYFMLAFPALAIAMACGLRFIPEAIAQVVLLALLYCGQRLYLFVILTQRASLYH